MSKYIVTCICHGDSCDGHATKIGNANDLAEAEAIIKDDMNLFCRNIMDMCADEDAVKRDDFKTKFATTQAEIWYDDQNGRVYDVIEA